MPRPHWSIFCQVIDNLGDIGVTWRLAKDLAERHAFNVTLWVDDLASFNKLSAHINVSLDIQSHQGINVVVWHPDPLKISTLINQRWHENPPDVVIEAFACNLPESAIAFMRDCQPAPIWINLEYLSAEDWVEGCHKLPSPQQGLKKYFFFPGFTAKTGGLIRGKDADKCFQKMSDLECRSWLAQTSHLHLSDIHPNAQKISLFAYAPPALPFFLEVWANATQPTQIFLPLEASSDTLIRQIKLFFQVDHLLARKTLRNHQIWLTPIDLLSHQDYDKWLTQMDINMVRGEDSFVRAQWAGVPFLWQIYPQNAQTHEKKLQAFLNRYGESLPLPARSALDTLWILWNTTDESMINTNSVYQAWESFMEHQSIYRLHAQAWAKQLMALGELSDNLLNFVHTTQVGRGGEMDVKEY